MELEFALLAIGTAAATPVPLLLASLAGSVVSAFSAMAGNLDVLGVGEILNLARSARVDGSSV